MNPRYALPRPRTGPLTRLLRVMALLAGVFVMHGLQVTSGPTEMLGVPGAPIVARAAAAHPVANHMHTGPTTGHTTASGRGPVGGPATRPEDAATGSLRPGSGTTEKTAATTAATVMTATVAAHRAPSGGSAPCGNCDGHGHPGGQVCLGLLALGSIIAVLVAVLWRRALGTRSKVRLPRFVRPLSGRPPPRPDIYRLAVLLQ